MTSKRVNRLLGNLILAFVGVTVLLWALALLSMGRRFPPLTKAQAIEIAEHNQFVVQAIYDYRADHGAYPKKMSDLVPTYIPSVPDEVENIVFEGDTLNIAAGRPHTSVYFVFYPGAEGWYAGGESAGPATGRLWIPNPTSTRRVLSTTAP